MSHKRKYAKIVLLGIIFFFGIFTLLILKLQDHAPKGGAYIPTDISSINSFPLFICGENVSYLPENYTNTLGSLRYWFNLNYSSNYLSYVYCSDMDERLVTPCLLNKTQGLCQELIPGLMMFAEKERMLEIIPDITLMAALPLAQYPVFNASNNSKAIQLYITEHEQIPIVLWVSSNKSHPVNGLNLFIREDSTVSTSNPVFEADFHNLLIFKHVQSANDCKQMILTGQVLSDIFSDACTIHFIKDKKKYCQGIVDQEIAACERVNKGYG